MNEMQKYLNDRNEPIHVICIQETHYNNKTKQPFTLKGYQAPIIKNRPDGSMAGGVAIYVKQGVQFTEKTVHSNNEIEVCAITVYGKFENIDV